MVEGVTDGGTIGGALAKTARFDSTSRPAGTGGASAGDDWGWGSPVKEDEELMTALYTDHYSVLLGFVSRYVQDRHRAEDVVQETLLRAWRKIDKIGSDNRTNRSYLFAIARNIITDNWRLEQRRPRLVSDDDAIAAVPSGEDVEAAVEGWLVTAAMERLSTEHRAVIEALYYEGRTVADAARRLTVPEGTVKSRAYYAVRALRAIFEETGVLR